MNTDVGLVQCRLDDRASAEALINLRQPDQLASVALPNGRPRGSGRADAPREPGDTLRIELAFDMPPRLASRNGKISTAREPPRPALRLSARVW